MWRRLLLTLVGLGLLGAGAGTARATVARALSLTELTHLSQAVVVGTPSQLDCKWEVVGGQKRIVTYTRMTVSTNVFGLEDGVTEVTVRTLGGRIGDLGQIVHGEARLDLNRPALVFLRRGSDTTYRVTAMSQGHYGLTRDEGGVIRVRPGGRGAHLLGGPLASVRLVGLDLAAAIDEILKARTNG